MKKDYKYLGILEVDSIKKSEIKEKNKEIVLQTNEKTSRSEDLT